MSNKIEVRYEINTGYAGNRRPQHVTIYADDFFEVEDNILEDAVAEDVDIQVRNNLEVDILNMDEIVEQILEEKFKNESEES